MQKETTTDERYRAKALNAGSEGTQQIHHDVKLTALSQDFSIHPLELLASFSSGGRFPNRGTLGRQIDAVCELTSFDTFRVPPPCPSSVVGWPLFPSKCSSLLDFRSVRLFYHFFAAGSHSYRIAAAPPRGPRPPPRLHCTPHELALKPSAKVIPGRMSFGMSESVIILAPPPSR